MLTSTIWHEYMLHHEYDLASVKDATWKAYQELIEAVRDWPYIEENHDK
jgi:hypothetical protein